MIPSEELHIIIQALSKSEKIWVAKHLEPGSDHQKLYEIIRQQQNYDERKLRVRLKGESVVKRLAVAKNYLFNFILRQLSEKYFLNEPEKILIKQLHYVELLHNKGVTKSALKLVLKVKKECLEMEFFSLALSAIRLEMLLRSRIIEPGIEIEIENLHQEELLLIRKHENIIRYRHLEMNYRLHFQRISNPRTTDDFLVYKSLLKHPLLQREDLALSIEARILFNYINGNCTYILKNYKLSLKFRQQAAQLYEKITLQTQAQVVNYSAVLFDLTLSYRNLNRFDDALSTIRHAILLEREYSQLLSNRHKSILFANWAMVETDVFQYFGHFEEGVKRIPDILKSFNLYRSLIKQEHRIILTYNLACLYYGAGDFKKALQQINTILVDYRGLVTCDIVGFCHIFRLIIHIDMGNMDLIRSIVNTAIRYLEKRRRLFPTEQFFLDFSMQLITGKNQSISELCRKMKPQLEKIIKLDSEKNIVEFFDFRAWFISKIEHQTYGRIYKELRNSKIRD